MSTLIEAQFAEALEVLSAFSNLENYKKIDYAADLMVNALKYGGKILSCGNGGSMCDAMHFAEELTGRFRENRPALAAMSLSDVSHISCVSNDFGYEAVFSRMIEAFGKKGDVLLAISTSGNSPNVLKAIEAAKQQGMRVIGLTGKTGGAMKDLCDVEIRAPQSAFADRAQEIHIKVIHCLILSIEQKMGYSSPTV